MLDIEEAITRISMEISELTKKLAILEQAKIIASDGTRGEYAALSARVGKTDQPKNSKRRDQLIAFISNHGPMKRADLVQGSGLPLGTVSYLLRDKEVFQRFNGNRWGIHGERPDIAISVQESD